MSIQKCLPFEEGQLAEAKSFMKGYRGAWFRCKIKKILTRKNELSYAMDYYDYPEDDTKLIKVYQFPQRGSKHKLVQKELMVRPEFPCIYREDEVPDISTISNVIVVVDGVWKIGDLVDWWKDDCFWSGSVIEIEAEDKVKIKLPDYPQGEGSSYSVNCKDLRPSLDWSPESGWEIQNGRSCPRLIQPVKQDYDEEVIKPPSFLEFDESMSSYTSTLSTPLSISSMPSKNLVKPNQDTSKEVRQQTHETDLDLSAGGSAVEKPSCSDNVSSTYVRDATAEAPGPGFVQEECYGDGSSKKMRVDEAITLNSRACSSLESTIVDMEELVNRIKWLRRILKFGFSSNSAQPTWNFVEHTAASTPK